MHRNLEHLIPPPAERPREGDLYKRVTAFGHTFELRYGYYEESDRRWGEPDVLYPDFLKTPVHTDEGEPFVTIVQDACLHFRGKTCRAEDSTCAECQYMKRSEDWFGLCTCPKNKRGAQ